MTDTEIKECQEWLDKLKLDDIPKGYKWQRSLMDITGIKHHENMWSDIYKFFFNEKEGHNMKDLFIRSLEQILEIEPNFLCDFKVEREYGAEKQKRIDILLKDEENHRAIIIENKIYHTLNNDLDNYYKSICREGYDDVKVVVLGLTKYKLKEGYKSIAHIGLLDKVFGNIHKYLPTANSNYVYLLQEFYKNIKNHTNMIDKNETDFFFENREKVARVHDVYREIKEYITNIMTLKKDSILKEYIENQKLELKKEKTGENEEYVKYIFKSNKDVMLTCFYKRILRPGNDLNPHILVVLEIQNKVKSSVENKHDHFRNILNNEFPMLKESETHGNIWRHYASMKIDIDSQSLTELPVFVKEKLDESKIIELGKRIIEETKGVK
ncbi:MAG: PD-(D/E)XK nuclease family protein [Bacteroidales bacterium]|nr:PD-(D/E)XK nuclease family protein [Bacteroidales bacterium]MBR3945722.1 PD-(D/E)XK nuclease family protein [Bacteroidales bacterium]